MAKVKVKAKKTPAKKTTAKKNVSQKTTTVKSSITKPVKKPAKRPATKTVKKSAKKSAKKPVKKPLTKAASKPAATKAGAAAGSTTKTAVGVMIPVDDQCSLKNKAKVVGDWDAMLNQTNIGANNNKFYVIQLLQSGGKYYTWTRWGRVGESGQNALLGNGKLDDAEKNFEKKFKGKTGNSWTDRGKFNAKSGKYSLIEIERSAEAAGKATEVEEKLRVLDQEAAQLQPKKKTAPSKLPPSLQNFMSLIFDHDMFRGAMASFDIDVKKMPLGQLSKAQVKKGYKVLEEMEKAISSKKSKRINDLSSQFYTVIPHAFGRRVPPPINTIDLLHKKVEMLNVLNDIEIALGMQKKSSKAGDEDLLPNPADENYNKVGADLEYVDPQSEEFAFIEAYTNKTSGSYLKPKVVDVFRVNRHGEADRFAAHDGLVERKLLWHGTNVAVVAAILGSGLRIMPHSGGRVGKGIYLASENGKSISYVGWSGRTGVMFLAEAALGKEHTITRDNWRLKAPPKGYDCIVARGRTEPDSNDDIEWDFDGKRVVVPQGKPTKQSKYGKSSFSQSEYLVYKESQVRIRYALRVKH